MTLGGLIAFVLMAVLIYSVIIVLMTKPESLHHRAMGIAAIAMLLIATATLKAEFLSVGG